MNTLNVLYLSLESITIAHSGSWANHVAKRCNMQLQNNTNERRSNVNEPQFGLRHIHHTKRNLPSVHINSVHLPQQDVKCLGLHLDRRRTWHKHTFTKRKPLGMSLTKMHWLLGRKSKLSTSNNIVIYKAKPESIVLTNAI
jgi:hypothetical protein